MRTTAPALQIRSNCIIGYQHLIDAGNLSTRWRANQREKLIENSKLKYSGQMTDGGRRRLQKAIDLLVQTSKKRRFYVPEQDKVITHQLAFITLTVSDEKNLSAREAYDLLLVHFLQWFRRTMKVNTYIWKAEVQQRGQIHYHITTPSYIPYQKIRDKWNTLQQSAGILCDYYKKQGHYDANSTDIHGVRDIDNIGGYLQKEYVKTIQNPYDNKIRQPAEALEKGEITLQEFVLAKECIIEELKGWGKLWDCSANLKAYGRFTIIEDSATGLILNEMIAKKEIVELRLEQCAIYKTSKKRISQILPLSKLREYDIYLDSIRNYKRQESVLS